MQAKFRRAIGLMLKGGGALLLIGIVAGTVYEEVGRRRDRERLPQTGQAVDIGGRSLNIYCSGAGGPAVILDAGAGSPGYSWAHIQPELARFTRACWYDRAGEGWSAPGPYPRTSAAMARDLHELLQRAGVPAPYVLVGHSLGGLNVRVYNGLYPGEVAGMVLVDSAHEDEPNRAPPSYQGPKPPRYLWHPLHLLFKAAARVGLVRLFSPAAPLPTDPAQRTREQIVEALRRRPEFVATSNSVGVVAPDSYAQARSAAGLGDRPLIVLTRGRPPTPSGNPELDRQVAAYEQAWMHEMQAGLARLSTRGRQVIVEQSGHSIPEQAPQAVIEAVREVLTMIRDDHTGPTATAR